MRNRSARARTRVIGVELPGRRPWHDTCCWPECDGESVDGSVPLCQRHHLKAWRTFEKMAHLPIAELRRELAQENCEGMFPITPHSTPNITQGAVYFIRFSDRVKIGFTTDLRRRLGDLPYDEVLGVRVPATMTDERRLHKAFARLRVTGEWFRAEPELLTYIARTAKPYDPDTPTVRPSLTE